MGYYYIEDENSSVIAISGSFYALAEDFDPYQILFSDEWPGGSAEKEQLSNIPSIDPRIQQVHTSQSARPELLTLGHWRE